MEKIVEFLQDTPGPWAVGIITQSEEPLDLTAGSCILLCQTYQVSDDSDCIIFVQEQNNVRTGEVVVPLPPLEYLYTDEEGAQYYLNNNLIVNVDGFMPQSIIYLKPTGM